MPFNFFFATQRTLPPTYVQALIISMLGSFFCGMFPFIYENCPLRKIPNVSSHCRQPPAAPTEMMERRATAHTKTNDGSSLVDFSRAKWIAGLCFICDDINSQKSHSRMEFNFLHVVTIEIKVFDGIWQRGKKWKAANCDGSQINKRFQLIFYLVWEIGKLLTIFSIFFFASHKNRKVKWKWQ